jgi:hypothetical protein
VGRADMDNGSTDLRDIAAMIEGYELVDARLALINDAGGWQVLHGEVALDTADRFGERVWRYPKDVFLQRRLPARVAAGLLCEEPQSIDGLKVVASKPSPNFGGVYQRLPGQAEWNHRTIAGAD